MVPSHTCFYKLTWAEGIFDFSSETAEQNSTKLDRKQDLNALYQVCVFRADRKNKMAALASDWLRHIRLLLWNCCTEFNKTWREVRSQCPLSSLCFSGRSEKQDGHPGLWLAETFSTSPLKLLSGIQRNLTGSNISGFAPQFRTKVARVRIWIKGSWRLWFGIRVLYFHRMLNITYQVLEVD